MLDNRSQSHNNNMHKKKRFLKTRKFFKENIKKTILGSILIALLSSWILNGLSLIWEKLEHIHNFSCFEEFVKNYKLIIPKYPKIPAIVFLKVEYDENEIAIKPKLFSPSHYMNALSSLFKISSESFTEIHSKASVGECTMHIYREIINVSTKMLPKIKKGTYLDFFASKPSVSEAKNSLNQIFKDSFVDKDKRMTDKKRNFTYSGYIRIELEDNGSEEAQISVKFNEMGELPDEAEKSFESIENYEDFNLDVEKQSDDIRATIFYPLKISKHTYSNCRKCHSIENFHNNFFNKTKKYAQSILFH